MVLAHNINNGIRTQDVCISQEVTFDTMLLGSHTLRGLKKSGFYKPSPIQLHGIPLGKCGFDLLLEAKSGTGKTAVFSVIALEMLELNKGLQGIILAPTREIAAQIYDVVKQIGSAYEGLNVEVVMGGMPLQDDISKFKNKVHIVVGSPGRLRHLIQDKHIDTSAVRLLVLDEADKLMEKSFQADINYIYSTIPKQKQVILSSATFPESSKSFIKQYIHNVQHICPGSNCILRGVTQKMTTVKFNSNIVKQTYLRFEETIKILANMQFKQCLIFCNYQVRVQEVHKMLTKAKWPAEQLYGQQDQAIRLEALKTLQEYKCRILISTDLAARGIDASNVDLVINFEPPIDWQTYLHRIGRAGRFGSYGLAITILSEGKECQKFKTMLEPLKDTLNITSLWEINSTEHQPEIHNPKVSPQLAKNPTQSNNDIWKSLVQNNENNKTEDFIQLCQSFEMQAMPTVETFSDLVNSFEINSHEANSEYQVIAVPTFSASNFIMHMTHSSELAHNIDNGESSREKNNNVITNNNLYNHKSFSITHTNEIDVNLNSEQELDENEVDQHDINKSLIDSGLPTSFSSKNKDYYKKQKKNRKHRNNNLQNTTTDVNHDNDPCELKYNGKFSDLDKINNAAGYNIEINKDNSHYQSATINSKNYSHHQRQSVNVNADISKLSNQYLDWYSQLKFKMKQIELAVYLNEISQL